MSYCTLTDILSACDEDDLITATDDEDTGAVDQAVITQAIAGADALVDAHISGRYGTGLDPVPPLLNTLALDICVYKLLSRRGDPVEHYRKRYEDAVKMLESIRAGKSDLPGVVVDDDSEDVGSEDAAAAVVTRPGFFTDGGMEGF